MKYAELLESIKEITTVVSAVPEKLQERCFELLLKHLLGELPKSSDPGHENRADERDAGTGAVALNSALRVFTKKYGISQQQINTLLMVEAEEVHFLREPNAEKLASAQVDWALLLALKAAVLNGVFMVDPEDVRSVCKDKSIYDRSNFASTFSYKANADLFKGEMKAQGEPQQLTDAGLSQLAELVKQLSS